MRPFTAANRNALMVALLLAAGVMAASANGRPRSLLQSTAAPGGPCGPNVGDVCGSGQCCSQFGWCGATSDHCGSGCQSSWGTCSGGSTSGSGGDTCAKCNVPIASGGCKCDNNCDCIPTGGDGGGVLYSRNNVGGTYYFDVRATCPSEPNGFPETDGYPACASFTPGPFQQTLRQVGSNNVVAINADLLASDRARYCGKKVLVYKDGVQVRAPDGGDFFVWDGCAACVRDERIDFSVSGLRNVDANACNLGVVPGVSFQVVDEQVRPFVA